MEIPNGSTLYEVYAMDKPKELGGVETHIADLVLNTKLTTSKWGDEHFFIRLLRACCVQFYLLLLIDLLMIFY
ncbi:MAG: hypothetical protein NZ730_11120 [Porticoccaceae bacterium]|nr:hypothetical protein [Porticoccaceae bacterium]